MDPPRHAVDKILSPSQLAPPPAAAVGPPPRKLPGVEGPPPKKLATAVSAEEHPQSKDTTPFQKVTTLGLREYMTQSLRLLSIKYRGFCFARIL